MPAATRNDRKGDAAPSSDALTDFAAIMLRLWDGGAEAVEALMADWRAAVAAGTVAGEAAIWEAFFREREHVLRRAFEFWPAHKILLQLAMEHGDDSPVTAAAEQWLEAGSCDWTWFRDPARPRSSGPSPCLRVFDSDDSTSLQDVLTLGEDRLVSWDYWKVQVWDRSTGNRLSVLKGHREHIDGFALHHGGLAVSWAKQEFHAWDLMAGERLGDLTGHADKVRGAAFLEDGRLVSWSDDHTARLWDVRERRVLATLKDGDAEVSDAAMLPDGRLATWSLSADVRFWDLDAVAWTGRLKGRGRGILQGLRALEGGGHAAWDPWSGELVVWNAAGTATYLPVPKDLGSLGAECRILPGGLAVAWERDFLERDKGREVFVWDLNQPAYLGVLRGHAASVVDLDVLPDGRLLSWSLDGTLRLWDRWSLDCLAVLEGHHGKVRGALLLGSDVLSWGGDGTLRLWDPGEGACRKTFHCPAFVEGARLLGDGILLTWDDLGGLRLWDTTREPLEDSWAGDGNRIAAVVSLGDGRVLTYSDKAPGIRLWDPVSDTCLAEHLTGDETIQGIRRLDDGRVLIWDENMRLLVFDPRTDAIASFRADRKISFAQVKVLAGGRFAWWGDGPEVYVWSGREGEEPLLLEGHGKSVEGVLELPGRRLLTWAKEPEMRVWNLAIRKPRKVEGGLAMAHCEKVLEGHAEEIRGAVLAPDGILLSWAEDGHVGIWDPDAAGAEGFIRVSENFFDHIASVTPMPDGTFVTRSILSSSPPKVWDRRSGMHVTTFGETIDASTLLPIGPDRLLASSWTGKVEVWDCSTGQVLERYDEAEVIRRRPDLQHLLDKADAVEASAGGAIVWRQPWGCGISAACAGDGILAAWCGDAWVWSRPVLLGDGTLAAGCWDGRMRFLHLYRSRERIGLDALAAELAPLVEPSTPREGAISVRRQGDSGFVLEVGSIVRPLTRSEMESLRFEIAKALADGADEEERIDRIRLRRALARMARMRDAELRKWLEAVEKEDLVLAVAFAYDDDAFCGRIARNLPWKTARLLHEEVAALRERGFELADVAAAIGRLEAKARSAQ